eukprot:10851769-Heterocapsa_arctica.AAC.1
MGDLNGVSFAQATHDGIIEHGGCRAPSEVLKYQHPVPRAPVWKGTYVDDRLVSMVLPKSRLCCAPDHDPQCHA